jgi:hypothetical protein
MDERRDTQLTVPHSPYVILNDFGGAFAMGAIGGGIWHGIKGARNSPRVSECSGCSGWSELHWPLPDIKDIIFAVC